MAVRKKKLKVPYSVRTQNLKFGSYKDISKLRENQDSIDNRLTNFNDGFSTYIAKTKTDLLNAQKFKEATSGVNSAYYRRMTMMCCMPLMRGLSADSILSSAGMYLGMCLVDKNFKKVVRNSLHQGAHKALDVLENSAHNRVDKFGIFKNTRHDMIDDKYSALRDFVDKKYSKNGKKGRIPFTPESAAEQNIALDKKAYFDMRQPGANINEILSQHREAKKVFFDLAAMDGVSKDQILQQSRIIIGKANRYQNAYSTHKDSEGYTFDESNIHDMYQETAFGNVSQSAYHEEEVEFQDKKGDWHVDKQNVWTGEYQTENGQNYTDGFTPRPPLNKEDVTREWNSVANHISNSQTYDECLGRMQGVYSVVGGLSDTGHSAVDSRIFNEDVAESAHSDIDKLRSTYRMWAADYGNQGMKEFATASNSAYSKIEDQIKALHPEWADQLTNDMNVFKEQTAAWHKDNPFDAESRTYQDFIDNKVEDFKQPENAEPNYAETEFDEVSEEPEVEEPVVDNSRGAQAAEAFKNVMNSNAQPNLDIEYNE